jgi:hypothetical protein
MGRRLAAIAAVLLLLGAGCGDEPTGGDSDWALEVDTVVEVLANSYDVADAYETARFFSAGGSLDLTTFGLGVATTPEAAVQAVRRLWFIEDGINRVHAEHVFVAPDGAVVWWNAVSPDADGGQDFAQSYLLGTGGRTASRTFRGMEVPLIDPTPVEERALELFDRYVSAWSDRDPEALRSVYSPDAVVRDDLRGEEWRSLDALIAGLDTVPDLSAGPWPRVFVYEAGADVQAIALVQLGGDCPMLEARRLVLSGERITRETRLMHLPSARRCLTGLRDGWWTTFELAPALQSNVTEVIDVGGSLVDLVNAEPIHEEFSRWLFDRYVEAGIGLPEVRAIWFPPAPECDELGGLAIETDERYEGRHTVVLCFTADRVLSDTSASGWAENAAAYGLHELAHLWMVDQLTDDARESFNERAGLRSWRSSATIWRERGVEHAAFTIPWGIAGAADARYPILPRPECDELAARYELLTGRAPITACGEGGWSP